MIIFIMNAIPFIPIVSKLKEVQILPYRAPGFTAWFYEYEKYGNHML